MFCYCLVLFYTNSHVQYIYALDYSNKMQTTKQTSLSLSNLALIHCTTRFLFQTQSFPDSLVVCQELSLAQSLFL